MQGRKENKKGGFFQAVGNLKDQIIGAIPDSLKHGAHQVVESVKDESQMHQFLAAFKRQVEYDLIRSRDKMQPDSVTAAEEIIRDLDNLLKKDSDNPQSKIPQQQYDLLCNACEVIDRNIVKMTAEPGFVNRLIAGFNEKMQQWFGIKDCINLVDKTEITKSQDELSVPNFKDELYKIKGQADEQAFGNTMEAMKEEISSYIKKK